MDLRRDYQKNNVTFLRESDAFKDPYTWDHIRWRDMTSFQREVYMREKFASFKSGFEDFMLSEKTEKIVNVVFAVCVTIGSIYFMGWCFTQGVEHGKTGALECMEKYNDKDLCEKHYNK